MEPWVLVFMTALDGIGNRRAAMRGLRACAIHADMIPRASELTHDHRNA